MPLLAKNMLYNTEYEQKISEDKEKETKQTMFDVDLVMLADLWLEVEEKKCIS